MEKMPPKEKIPEAWSAIADGRVVLKEDCALVSSSDGKKQYTVRWKEGVYASDDNATYWQGYPGYPVIAVWMLQGILPLEEEIIPYFKGINWHELNKKAKRDYARAYEEATADLPIKEQADAAVQAIYEAIGTLDLTIRRKIA